MTITKQRKKSNVDKKITGNKQSPKKLLIDRHDSSMMPYDKKMNGNAYASKDKRETHESPNGVPSEFQRN